MDIVLIVPLSFFKPFVTEMFMKKRKKYKNPCFWLTVNQAPTYNNGWNAFKICMPTFAFNPLQCIVILFLATSIYHKFWASVWANQIFAIFSVFFLSMVRYCTSRRHEHICTVYASVSIIRIISCKHFLTVLTTLSYNVSNIYISRFVL